MRKLTPSEVLSISKLLQLETNSLAVAKATMNVINDDQLKALGQAGINATEARIMGIQQFIAENNITTAEGVQ